MKNKVLVTGGCGYIGSHTIVDLLDNGFEVISVDSTIRSNENVLEGIREITGVSVQNYKIDLCDLEATKTIFKDHQDIKGIIHFAALKSVPESVEKPLAYFNNNLNSLLSILGCQKEFDVPHFIFSSSCSVYGNTTALPVTETTPFMEAECPYARTKQIGEQIVQDFTSANLQLNGVILRYFNPAGAHESAKIGELTFDTAAGKRESFTVFGSDYGTRDGSCVRDYIHVMDLANAHTKAIQYLDKKANNSNCEIFNLGIGQGVTVLEAIHAFEKVTAQSLNYKIGPRRPGDVEAIYSNYDLAAARLGWNPTRNIEDIMRSAWAWECGE